MRTTLPAAALDEAGSPRPIELDEVLGAIVSRPRPRTMASAIAPGDSLLGLSFVTKTRSAPSAAARPMSGRLWGSRLPPQPKTQEHLTRRSGAARLASTRASASGVCA